MTSSETRRGATCEDLAVAIGSVVVLLVMDIFKYTVKLLILLALVALLLFFVFSRRENENVTVKREGVMSEFVSFWTDVGRSYDMVILERAKAKNHLTTRPIPSFGKSANSP